MDFDIKPYGKIIIYAIIFYVLFCLCLTTVLYFVSSPGSVVAVLEFAKEYLKEWAKGIEPDNQYFGTICNVLAPVYKFASCDERDFSENLKIVMDHYLAKVAPFLPTAVQNILDSYRSDLLQMVVKPCCYLIPKAINFILV
ncbi:hypothetical protein AVEN_193135-1 [Araneus ventricosus]|uniref:Uncharacterized protein n=1 Tax=Araneus ventricosus TaxID=182803 RepID=A0A4Y2B0Z4_ARAVE|nr:hypothetical protein AVEN_193135-1 [Araneus ventricosus]